MNAHTNSDDARIAQPGPAIDPRKARIVREFQQTRAPNCCHFDRSGRFLFVGSEENAIQLWNLETRENTTLNGHDSWVRGFVFPPQDETFVSGGYEGDLIWWTRESSPAQVTHRVRAHRGWIRSITLSPDGRLLASAGNDRIVKVWSLAEQAVVAELVGHEHDICSVAFHPDGNHVASSDSHGVVRIWEQPTWQQTREFDASSTYVYNKSNRGPGGGLRGLLFSPDGRMLIGSGVVGGGDPLGQAVNPGAIVFDWKSGGRQTLLRARGNELGVAWGLVYHPTENFIAAVSGGMSAKHVYFWRTSEEQPFHVIELPSPGRGIALHPDGLRFAVGLHDGKIQIYTLV